MVKVKVVNETTGKVGYAIIKDGVTLDNPMELVNPELWEKLVIDGKEVDIEAIKDKVDYDGAGIFYYEE